MVTNVYSAACNDTIQCDIFTYAQKLTIWPA